MTDSASKLPPLTMPQRVPLWLWILAFLLGVALAAASLNYAPTGRINVLWLWLLWAGLPLLGSLISLWFLCVGRTQPWLFRWREHRIHWHPTPAERLRMLATLQQLWLIAGLGLLLGYLTLLLFTDLAFGWSSTLIDEPGRVVSLTQAVAAPWQWFWPSAVPSGELVEATRYARIDPLANQVQWAGDWWRFLLASLLFYNLLPRSLIAIGIALVLSWRGQHQLRVRAPTLVMDTAPRLESSADTLANWQSAPALNWEIIDVTGAPARLHLGIEDWQKDEQAVKEFLQSPPQKLRWQVNATRSPVAELSDLINLARRAGVQQQALRAITNASTDPQRHIASWRAFANKQQLVWLEESH